MGYPGCALALSVGVLGACMGYPVSCWVLYGYIGSCGAYSLLISMSIVGKAYCCIVLDGFVG